MERFGVRVLLVLLLVSFGVFYGVDLATTGTERLHGPLASGSVTDADATVEDVDRFEPDESRGDQIEAEDDEPELPPPDVFRNEHAETGRLAKWIGKSLQRIAHAIVESIVAVFEALI